MSTNGWETLDVEALLSRREEAAGGTGATTSANAGPYAVPIGAPMRRKFPTQASGYEKLSHPYLPKHESHEGMDLDLAWAKKMTE